MPQDEIKVSVKGPLAYYVRKLLQTGLYGSTPQEVVIGLVQAGVRNAVTKKMIEPRRFDDDGKLT